jgi:hypothetical protein
MALCAGSGHGRWQGVTITSSRGHGTTVATLGGQVAGRGLCCSMAGQLGALLSGIRSTSVAATKIGEHRRKRRISNYVMSIHSTFLLPISNPIIVLVSGRESR